MNPIYENQRVKLYQGDCLEIMPQLDMKFDACITDPPYGTTACKWDSVIPFEDMWKNLKKLVKPNGAICLFGSEPFSSALRMSNLPMFKYDWVWVKNNKTGFLNAKKQPLRCIETISVFYEFQSLYIPQMKHGFTPYMTINKTRTENYGSQRDNITISNGDRFPTFIMFLLFCGLLPHILLFDQKTNNRFAGSGVP